MACRRALFEVPWEYRLVSYYASMRRLSTYSKCVNAQGSVRRTRPLLSVASLFGPRSLPVIMLLCPPARAVEHGRGKDDMEGLADARAAPPPLRCVESCYIYICIEREGYVYKGRADPRSELNGREGGERSVDLANRLMQGELCEFVKGV